MNRVFSESFPDTVCEVVLQENMKTCQFSWWCDGKSDTPRNYAALEEARRVAMFVYGVVTVLAPCHSEASDESLAL